MSKARPPNRLHIEPLEPRLLFSASLDIGLLDTHKIFDLYSHDEGNNPLVQAYLPEVAAKPITPTASAVNTSPSHLSHQLIVIDTRIEHYQTLVLDVQKTTPTPYLTFCI